MLPNLGGLSLREAAPTAGCHDDDLASATSDEDQAPCPSRCHKEKEDDESYKCYKPCGDDEPEPLVTAPDEPLLELAPPAASATPVLSGTTTTTTGAPVSLTRFADRPVTRSGDDDAVAVSPDVVIGWFAEAARSMQPVILTALNAASDASPDAAPVAQRELEQLQGEAQAARAAAQATLDEDWEGKTVALPRPDGEAEMVEVPLLAAGQALVEMQAAVHNKTRWAPPKDGVTRMKEWLPLATVDDARGGFYTDANEMDVDRLKLDRWRKQFADAFPYLISPAMQEAGVAEADPAYWAAKLERLQSEERLGRAYTKEQLDDFKEAHYIEFPHAAPLTPKQRADMKAICVEAVLEIQSIIDKHDYNHQRYEAMRAEGKETFGVRRNGKDRVELALKAEHTQTYYRIRQATDKAVREGRARKGERDTVSKAGTFAELVRTITAPGRVVPQKWPLAAVNGIVAWAKDEWLPARIAERNRFTESKDKARAALDAAAKPYHDAVSTRDRALDQLAALAADEEKMDVAFGHAMMTLAPLDKQDFATLASLFHAFRSHHDARTDGVRMLDESGAPPAAAHPPTNSDLARFLASNAFDLIAVPDKGNVLVHRVAGPRWMRDLRLQRVLHALLAEWQVTPTYELNRTADYDNSVHAVLKARRDSPAALTACRAAALAIEAGARYARARLGARRLLTTKPVPEDAAAAGAGVVLGWDVPALAGPLAATMAAPPGAPALLPWLADDAPFAAQQLDTAHHAMTYLFGALGGGGGGDAALVEPLPEGGWARRALAGYAREDEHSRCAAILVRAGEVGAGGAVPTSEVLEFGTLPAAAAAVSASVGGAIRRLHPTAAADDERSVRGTYAHLFRKLHPEMLRLARHGPGSAGARLAEERYKALREAWAAEVLSNPEEAARRHEAYVGLGVQLKSAEAELAAATTARYKAAKQQCDEDAESRQPEVASEVRAAMQREMAAAKRVSELLRERADLMLPSTAAELLGRARSADAADADDAEPPEPEPELEPEPMPSAPAEPPTAAPPRPRKRSALEEVVAAMARHARREQERNEAVRQRRDQIGAGPEGGTDVADAEVAADSDASLFVVNPFLYKDPNAVVELARFRDDPLRAVCLASDNNGRVFLLIKDPEGTEHNANCRVRIERGKSAPGSFARRLFVATPRGDPVQIPELVKIVFGDDAAARDPAGWEPVQPDARLAASSALPRPAEQGAEHSAPLVALARALVLCVALEARERDLFYPWLGNVPTAEPDQYMECARCEDYYGDGGYAVARDQASLTSSFAVGYGPGCALLAAASAHAAGEGDERLADLWGR